MIKDSELVDLLRYSRHDWLNAIQLIKGNLALNHIDRAKEIIDTLIMKSKNEAKLSNLQIQQTSVFLLTYNWFPHRFKLDLEIIGDHRDLSNYDEAINNMSRSLFKLLDEHGSNRFENHVLYTVQLMEDETYLSIDFSGKIEALTQFSLSFENLTYQSMNLIEHYIEEDEALFTYQIQEEIYEVE